MIQVLPVEGLPEIAEGDDLGGADRRARSSCADGDVVCVAQKVVSKAEGRVVAPRRRSSRPSEARELAGATATRAGSR